MRSRKTIINTVFALLEELCAIVCGFILPRLILSAFGSKYNGLTTSITQFLSCAVLLRAGIGGVTRVALYKPLANNDKDKINSIIKATDNFMKKVGLILAVCILIFAVLYPVFVRNEFEWFFTFSLFAIIGISTFAESFFGITYLIILQADQKLWVSSLMKSICYILNTILAALLIYLGFGIHGVKLGSSIIYVLYPIILQIYVRKKYNIDKNVKPDNQAISQRWDAFWHQVASFVMLNTDVIVLTIFTNMLQVSIYSIYNLVFNGIKRIITSFSNGLEAAFGNMIAKKETKVLKENVSIIEFIFYSVSTIVYTSAAMLILQFIDVYTAGINDTNYIQPLFAYILLLSQFFSCIRIPYQMVVQAAGHYKQTKNGAIIEPIINLSLSIVFVIKFGLVGVAIGTFAATIFRTAQYLIYMSSKVVKRNFMESIIRIFISLVEAIVIIVIVRGINLDFQQSYLSWCINSVIVFMVSFVVVSLINCLIFNNDFKRLKFKLCKKGRK